MLEEPLGVDRRYYDVKMKLNANFVFMEISYLDFFFAGIYKWI